MVKNEGRFIWYSLNSVLPFVDQIMVWDTGSTDGTIQIIQSIKSPKIAFKEVGEVDPDTFTTMRQQMLKETPKNFTWLMILDGDEIWPETAIENAVDFARSNPKFESIVVKTNNLVGDIYHKLPESSGRYHLAGRTGHLNLRFMNLKTIPGLNVQKPHGQQGYFDKNGKLVQDRNQKKIKFIDVAYFHATHLQRSVRLKLDAAVPKRKQKLKYEIGDRIDSSEIPEIFYTRSKPEIVPDVTASAPLTFWLQSLLMTLPRRIKRQILPEKLGY